MKRTNKKHSASGMNVSVAKALVLILSIGFAAASKAAAHQTFLLPDTFQVEAGSDVDISLTSALAFPNLEHGPVADRIAFSKVMVRNTALENLTFSEGETALTLNFSSQDSGLAMIAVSSKPRGGEIPPEDVDVYLDEIEAPESVRAAFHALPDSPALNRSYSKHAKTFICIESCGDRKTAKKPAGQKIEFVAVDATQNTFRLLYDGKPLQGKSVTIARAIGETSTILTNDAGEFQPDEALSGIVMFAAVVITLPETPDGVYHSDYATLTVNLSQ